MQVDVVIVGAGPAGSTAARELVSREAGRQGRVLLLDRATFPRDKPCGGGVTPRTARLLPFSLDPVIEDVVHGARIRMRDGREVTRRSAEPLTYMTQRRHLDHYLVERAQEAGVEFRDGQAVRAIEALRDGRYEVRTRGETIRARVVIGADGANGIVGTCLGYEHAAQSAVALEGNVPFPRGVPDEFRGLVVLNFGYLAGGYGWIFPKGDHVNVGIGGWKDAAGKRLRPALRHLCRLYGIDPDGLEQLRGHHLPMQRRGMVLAAGGSAVIGDAAGLVDPLSGEGIHAAVVSGMAIADPVDALLAGRAPSLHAYQDAIDHGLGGELAASKALMEIFHSAPAPFVWGLQHLDRVWQRAGELVRGEASYDDLAHTFGRLGALALPPVAALARRRTAAGRAG